MTSTTTRDLSRALILTLPNIPYPIQDIILDYILKKYLIISFSIGYENIIFTKSYSPCIGDNYNYTPCQDCSTFTDGRSITGIICYKPKGCVYKQMDKLGNSTLPPEIVEECEFDVTGIFRELDCMFAAGKTCRYSSFQINKDIAYIDKRTQYIIRSSHDEYHCDYEFELYYSIQK